MITQTFFDGMVGNTYCFVNSKIWTFGNHSIPKNSVSDIYVRRTRHVVWLVLSCVCFLTWAICALLMAKAAFLEGGASNILLVVAAVFLAVFFLTMKRSIVVVSKGSCREVIAISAAKNTEDYKKLYYALMDSLMEGEKYEPKNNPFLK